MIHKRTLTLAALLLIGLLLSACGTDVADVTKPDTNADVPKEEVAPRDVYSLTMGDGIVGQGMAKHGAAMTGALTPQSVSEIELDTENSLLYINADRAELESLKENDFLKDAVDNSVPVLIESAAAETLESLTSDLFGFSVPGNALLINRYATGRYSATPIGEANDMDDVLDMALSRSTAFRDLPRSASKSETAQTPSTVTTQQDGFSWEGDPTAIVARTDSASSAYLYVGGVKDCSVDRDCPVTAGESVRRTKTWEVSMSVDFGLGIGKASDIAIGASTTFSRSTSNTISETFETTLRPGEFGRAVIYIREQYQDGHYEGTLSRINCTSAPGLGTGCVDKETVEINNGDIALEYGATWNGYTPASTAITTWEIEPGQGPGIPPEGW